MNGEEKIEIFDFKGSYFIDFKLRAVTGLRIGGAKEQFEIGGLDNPVVKLEVPVVNFYEDGSQIPQGAPYIPGSSLKGKIRSLLEWHEGAVKRNVDEALKRQQKPDDKLKEAGKVCECGECDVCIIFGTGNAKKLESLDLLKQPGPTRMKVYDLYPTHDTLKRLKDHLGENIFTEIKTENAINRITSKANPRKVERVPAGSEFEGRIVFDVYREKDHDLLKKLIIGMQLLENNYLGGYGSRGSGRVKFVDITLTWHPKEAYQDPNKKVSVGNLKTLECVKAQIEKLRNEIDKANCKKASN